MRSQLRAFFVMIEEGSLNRASVRLRLTQSALTRQMQALETRRAGRCSNAPPRVCGRLCRRAGFRRKFGPAAQSLSHALTLIAAEGAVTLAPAYLRDFPAAGIAMVPLTEPAAAWDFLVVWQRGRTGGTLRALLDALAAAAEDECGGSITKPTAGKTRRRPPSTPARGLPSGTAWPPFP